MADVPTWMHELLIFMSAGQFGGLLVMALGAPDWGILAGIAAWMGLAITLRLIWIAGGSR